MLVNRGCGWQWRSRESLGTWTRFDFCLFLPKPLAASYRRICRALFVKALRRIVVRRLPRWPWSTCRGRSMSKNREFARLNSPLGCQTPPRRPLPTDWGHYGLVSANSTSMYTSSLLARRHGPCHHVSPPISEVDSIGGRNTGSKSERRTFKDDIRS